MHVILLWQPYQKINARIIDQKGVVVEVLGSYDYIQDLHKDLETRGYQVKNTVEKLKHGVTDLELEKYDSRH